MESSLNTNTSLHQGPEGAATVVCVSGQPGDWRRRLGRVIFPEKKTVMGMTEHLPGSYDR